MWWNRPMAAPLNLISMYSPGSFLAMWNKVYIKADLIKRHNDQINSWTLTSHRCWSTPSSYSLALVGLKAVHVVGATDAPGTQEFQKVDFHRSLHKDKVVVCHAEAEIEKETVLKPELYVSISIPNGLLTEILLDRVTHTCARRRVWTFQHWGTAPLPLTSQWDQIYLRRKELGVTFDTDVPYFTFYIIFTLNAPIYLFPIMSKEGRIFTFLRYSNLMTES